MIGLACFLLTVLFLAAIFFKQRFINSALSFVSGAPQKQKFKGTIPLWVKALLAKKFLEKSNPGQKDEKKDASDLEPASVEPEYPPVREESIEEINQRHEKNSEEERVSQSPEEPPPQVDETYTDSNIRFSEIEDPGPIDLPEINESGSMRPPTSKNTGADQGIIEEDNSFTSENKEADIDMDFQGEIPLSEAEPEEHLTEEKTPTEKRTGAENMNSILEQYRDPEIEEVRERNREKYLRILNASSQAVREDRPETASDQWTEAKPEEHQTEEKTPAERYAGTESMNSMLEQYRNPEMERVRTMNREKYLRFFNETSPANREAQPETANIPLREEQEALVQRYKEMEENL